MTRITELTRENADLKLIVQSYRLRVKKMIRSHGDTKTELYKQKFDFIKEHYERMQTLVTLRFDLDNFMQTRIKLIEEIIVEE